MQEDLVGLIDRWMTDEDFRMAFRANPRAAIQDAGFSLDESALAAVQAMDHPQRDHDLHQRVSKGL